MIDDGESAEPRRARSPFESVQAASIARNTAFSYLSLGIEMLVLLALTPFIISTLGVERFGVWSLLWSVISLFELVHMGMAEAVVKFVSETRARGDEQGHRERVATIFWGYVAQGFVVCVLTAVMYALFARVFESVPSTLLSGTRDTLVVLGLAAALGAPLSMFGGVLLAHQRQWQTFAVTIVMRILYAIAVFMVLPSAPSLTVLAYLSAAVALLQQVCVGVVAWTTIPGMSLRPRDVHWHRLREVYSFSVHFVLITAAYLIATRVDAFIIEAWLDVRAIAMYALALRMSTAIDAIATRVHRMLTPVFAELHGRGDQAQAVARLIDATRVSFALTVCGAGGALVLARPLIVAWVGETMLESVPVLRILLAAVLTGVIYEGVRGLLSMSGRHVLLARAIFAGQVLNLALSLALVRPFGLLGVATGTALGMLPLDIFVFQRTLTKDFGVSAWEFLRKSVGPSVLPGAVSLGLLGAASALLQPGSLASVALLELGAVTVFGVLYWHWGATASDKAFARAKLGVLRSSRPSGGS